MGMDNSLTDIVNMYGSPLQEGPAGSPYVGNMSGLETTALHGEYKPTPTESITDKLYLGVKRAGKAISGKADSFMKKYFGSKADDASAFVDKCVKDPDYMNQQGEQNFGDGFDGVKTEAGQALVASNGDPDKALKIMTEGRKKPFTLVELLTVIGIIAILASLLLPALNQAKFKAKEIECVNTLKNHGIAAVSYSGDHDGMIPMGTPTVYSGTSTNVINIPGNLIGMGEWLVEMGDAKQMYGCALHDPKTPDVVAADLEADAFTQGSSYYRETDNGFKARLSQNESKDAFIADNSDFTTGHMAHSGKSTNALYADGHVKKKDFVIHGAASATVDVYWNVLEDN